MSPRAGRVPYTGRPFGVRGLFSASGRIFRPPNVMGLHFGRFFPECRIFSFSNGNRCAIMYENHVYTPVIDFALHAAIPESQI